MLEKKFLHIFIYYFILNLQGRQLMAMIMKYAKFLQVIKTENNRKSFREPDLVYEGKGTKRLNLARLLIFILFLKFFSLLT